MKAILIFLSSVVYGLFIGLILKCLWGGELLLILGFIFIWLILLVVLSLIFGGN